MNKIPRIRTKYVKKLKKMLIKRNPCKRCPYAFWFWWNEKKKCETCLSFIGLKRKALYYNNIGRLHPCPCLRLGCTEALDRASSALLEWDLGKHKWQKEG